MTHKYSLRRFLRSVLERLRHIMHITKECIAPQERNRYDTSNVRNRKMSKITLNDVTNINAITTINDNFDKLEQELQNKVLYRDNPTGEPNDIKQDIDLNGFNLLNVGKVYSDDGEFATQDELVAIQAAVEADRLEVETNKNIVVATAGDVASDAASVASLYDAFDDRYLGAFVSDPVTDNDGSSLVEGALYFNTSTPKQMKVYNGAAWQAVATFSSTTTTSIDSSLYPSQLEAEEGTNNTKVMTPLRTAQAVAANTGVVHRTGNETIGGTKTFTNAPNGTYGKLLGIQIFETAGTYTYTETAGTRWIEAVVVGAGGSQGAAAPSAAGSVQIINGGGPGGYVKVRITSSMSGATITVGAGSFGGVTYPDQGSNGGPSSIVNGGISVTAYGGLKGGTTLVSSTFPFQLYQPIPSGFSCTGAVTILDVNQSHLYTTVASPTVVDSLTRATIGAGFGPLGDGLPREVLMAIPGEPYNGNHGLWYNPPKVYGSFGILTPGKTPPPRVISGAFSGYAEGFSASHGCVVIFEYA